MAARKKRRRKVLRPRRVEYKGEVLTFREIAEREGCSFEAVRKWWIRHGRTLDGFCGTGGHLKWGRKISWKDGEGMNLDTLFVRGRVDPDTYLRYLYEYERMMRYGRGRKAIGTIVNGRMSYRMSEREDYFRTSSLFPILMFDASPKDVDYMLGADCQPPDFRNAVVREVEDGGETWSRYIGECREPYKENWLSVGSVRYPSNESPFEDALDDLLGYIEDG